VRVHELARPIRGAMTDLDRNPKSASAYVGLRGTLLTEDFCPRSTDQVSQDQRKGSSR
jgi:hypothetical protein